jgi:hypothetical protein
MFYLNAWLSQIEPPAIHEIAPDASDTLIRAIEHQTIIGWEQWIYGRLSIYWGELYNYDRIHKKDVIPNQKIRQIPTTTWGKSINIISWNFLIATWCCRNSIEHQNENSTINRKKEKMIEKIMWLKSQIPAEKLLHYSDLSPDMMMSYPDNNIAMILENISNIRGMQ